MRLGSTLVLAALAFTHAGPQGSPARGDVELVGPLEGAVFACGERDVSVVVASLATGERRVEQVAFSARAGAQRLEPRLLELLRRPDDASSERGSARFLAWSPSASDEPPPPLARRSRPSLEATPADPAAPRARVGSVGLALIAASAAAVLALARRPLGAWIAGLAGAALLVALGAREQAPRGHSVLEGLFGQGAPRFLVAHGASGRLAWPADDPPLALEVSPAERACLWVTDLDADTASVRATRASLTAFTAWSGGARDGPPDPEALTEGRNGLGGDLSAVWTRSASGPWIARGAWRRTEPLPRDPESTAGSDSAPPGWLIAGLPPGRPVLVARAAAGAPWEYRPTDGRGEGGAHPAWTSWVRLVGYEP